MAKLILGVIVVLHAAIHLMGVAKATHPQTLPSISSPISKGWGVVWLSGALLMAVSGAALLLGVELWWAVALLSVVVSQVAIGAHFSEAKFGTIANVVVLIAATVSFGGWRFDQRTAALVQQLETLESQQPSFGDGSDNLPPPVRRYLEKVLPAGTPSIERAHLAQEGTFNTDLSKPVWKPFSAQQVSVTFPPGFVWSADIAMFPGIHARVHDTYSNQTGLLAPSLLGLIPLGSVGDTAGDVAQGELLRFLAEAPWYPTVLRDATLVTWSALDDETAHARLTDGSVVVGLRFHFGKDDLIDEVYAESRGRTAGAETIDTPWRGRFWNYEQRKGVLVPIECEVAWLLDSGPAPYFRAKITSLEFRNSQGAPP